MPYVMVPVPVEIESDIRAMLMRLELAAAITSWQDSAIDDLFDGLGPGGRGVLVEVARASVQGVAVDHRQVAESLAMSDDEVVDQVTVITEASEAMGQGSLVMMHPGLDAVPEDADIARMLSMGPKFAQVVLARVPQDAAGTDAT